jgi:3-oxoacyl-[acyl-carrier protein] reductase
MISGQVAVVTGASRGIGKACALRLAEEGARVVVNYQRSAAAAEAVVAEIVARGGEAFAIQADVADPEGAAALVDAAVSRYGSLQILVNNAGITRDALLLRMKPEDFDAVLAVDLRGPYLVTRAALRPMLKARYGRIVNVASVAGLVGNAGQANYAAAKAGLIGFTKAVAREVADRNITVNAVAPGFIETDMTRDLPDSLREMIPAGRTGSPAEVAAVVAFLASTEAAYITGETVRVDGGMAMA